MKIEFVEFDLEEDYVYFTAFLRGPISRKYSGSSTLNMRTLSTLARSAANGFAENH